MSFLTLNGRQHCRNFSIIRHILLFGSKDKKPTTHFPWTLIRNSATTSQSNLQFFEIVQRHIPIKAPLYCIDFLKDEISLRDAFNAMHCSSEDTYLRDNYIKWVSDYSQKSSVCLQEYFLEKITLEDMSKDFIKFCFENKIFLDKKRTLGSFKKHNQISDQSLQNELIKMQPKPVINLFGFGLDQGDYEKELAEFLKKQRLAKVVNIYGFDPFAHQAPGIEYLTADQINANERPKFDVIIARWVLHHVEFQHRWKNFVRCINRSNPGAVVLIVEHGFLKKEYTALEEKLYYFFNATFDIIANIGLRPCYFTDTFPNVGESFFIHYLRAEDFSAIQKSISFSTTQEIYDVGPVFPNQTICRLGISR